MSKPLCRSLLEKVSAPTKASSVEVDACSLPGRFLDQERQKMAINQATVLGHTLRGIENGVLRTVGVAFKPCVK